MDQLETGISQRYDLRRCQGWALPRQAHATQVGCRVHVGTWQAGNNVLRKEASGTACTPCHQPAGATGKSTTWGQQRDSNRLDSSWANNRSSDIFGDLAAALVSGMYCMYLGMYTLTM